MKILLRPNLRRRQGMEHIRVVAQRLGALSLTPMLEEKHREQVGDLDCVYGSWPELLERCDLVLPVGGDGTVLHAARSAVKAGKPILGVNAGRVGFLTQLELDEIDRLSLLKSGSYTVQERMMLQAVLPGGECFCALNDVVITRSDADRMVDLEVTQQNRLVVRQRADGLIFATPTGSTAYSLSAGGPIVAPELSVVILTAICPYATSHSSLVLPPSPAYMVREITFHDYDPEDLVVSIDGQRVGHFSREETVSVSLSELRVKFIDLGLRDFYTNLNEKLSWRR